MLDPHHHQLLADQSRIDPEVIAARGYRSLGRAELLELATSGRFPGALRDQAGALLIPIYRPDGERHAEVVRPDGPLDGRKYLWPNGVRNALDVHPLSRPYVQDPEVPLLITEGVKKADALLSAARAAGLTLCVVAINGNYGWRASTQGSTVATPDFFDLALKRRQVVLVPDSDYATNSAVRKGWDDLACYLRSKQGEEEGGAKVLLAVVPPKGLKRRGADDFLADGGTLEALLALARAPEQLELKAVDRLEVLTFGETRRLAGTEIRYLLQSYLPERAILVLAGYAETGKTWFALELLLDLALGRPFADHPQLVAREPLRAFYVNREMGRELMAVRINRLLAGPRYPEACHATIEQNLFLIDDARFDFNDPSVEQGLAEYIALYGPKVIVLDSFSMVWTGDENSNSEVAELYKRLRRLSQELGVSWVILHHLSKPQEKVRTISAHQIRGAGQIVNQADMAILLSRPRTERAQEAEGGPIDIAVHHIKSRDRYVPAWVVRLEDRSLGVDLRYRGELRDLVANLGAAASVESQQLEVLRVLLQDQRRALQRAEGMPAPLLYKLLETTWPAGEPPCPSERAFRKLLGQLVETGELITEQRGRQLVYRLAASEEFNDG